MLKVSYLGERRDPKICCWEPWFEFPTEDQVKMHLVRVRELCPAGQFEYRVIRRVEELVDSGMI